MTIYTAALLTTFGRNSPRPLYAAVRRLVFLAGGAFAIGAFLARGLEQGALHLPADPFLVFPGLLAVQLVVLFSLLTASGIVSNPREDRFTAWLLLLPLTRLQRWVALMLPQLLLVTIALLLVCWPLGALLVRLGLTPFLVVPVVLFGSLSALALHERFHYKLGSFHLLYVGLIVGTEYLLTKHIFTTHSWIAAGVLLVLVALVAGSLIWQARSVSLGVSANIPAKRVRGGHTPPWLWFAKKLLRSRTIQLGFYTSFAIGAAISLIAPARAELPPEALMLLAALLAAVSVADIHAVTLRHRPVEIMGLRGSVYFMTRQLAAAVCLGLLVAAPLVWVSLMAGGDVMTMASQLCVGIAAGLVAGTLFVPKARDVSSQCCATLVSTALLVVAPQFYPSGHWLWGLGASGVLLVAACGIEYYRNPYVWREYYARSR